MNVDEPNPMNESNDDSPFYDPPFFRDFGDYELVPRNDHFRELYRHTKSMDVILRPEGDPEEDIKAHKCVIASHSEYLDVMFLTTNHLR